jgi:hypothetical protein
MCAHLTASAIHMKPRNDDLTTYINLLVSESTRHVSIKKIYKILVEFLIFLSQHCLLAFNFLRLQYKDSAERGEFRKLKKIDTTQTLPPLPKNNSFKNLIAFFALLCDLTAVNCKQRNKTMKFRIKICMSHILGEYYIYCMWDVLNTKA